MDNFDLNISNYSVKELEEILTLVPNYNEQDIDYNKDKICKKIMNDTTLSFDAKVKLGDFFEVHEGVHSGNMRNELFINRRLDKTCRELLFGRGEISPYFLKWEGKYINLGAMPNAKSKKKYANIGNQEWYERDKLLIRRTGDYVLAAVDQEHRYASNNFFIVFPKVRTALDLNGLSALLNSRFITWYFRTIEPRQGRVFAELKIKHISTFSLPATILKAGSCDELNQLGAMRKKIATDKESTKTPDAALRLQRKCDILDNKIDSLVLKMLSIDPKHINLNGGEPCLEEEHAA